MRLVVRVMSSGRGTFSFHFLSKAVRRAIREEEREGAAAADVSVLAPEDSGADEDDTQKVPPKLSEVTAMPDEVVEYAYGSSVWVPLVSGKD